MLFALNAQAQTTLKMPIKGNPNFSVKVQETGLSGGVDYEQSIRTGIPRADFYSSRDLYAKDQKCLTWFWIDEKNKFRYVEAYYGQNRLVAVVECTFEKANIKQTELLYSRFTEVNTTINYNKIGISFSKPVKLKIYETIMDIATGETIEKEVQELNLALSPKNNSKGYVDFIRSTFLSQETSKDILKKYVPANAKLISACIDEEDESRMFFYHFSKDKTLYTTNITAGEYTVDEVNVANNGLKQMFNYKYEPTGRSFTKTTLYKLAPVFNKKPTGFRTGKTGEKKPFAYPNTDILFPNEAEAKKYLPELEKLLK